MLRYRFAVFQDDGSLANYRFCSPDDDEAIFYGLRNRTNNLCQLYDEHGLLASFDGMPQRPELPGATGARKPQDARLLAEVC